MTQESDAFDRKESLSRLLREVEEARAPGLAALAEVLRPFEEIETLAAQFQFDLPEGLREAIDEILRSEALGPIDDEYEQVMAKFRYKPSEEMRARFDRFQEMFSGSAFERL